MAETWAVMTVLFSAFLGSLAPICFKKAAGALNWRFEKSFLIDVIKEKWLYAGVAIPAIGTVLFVPALRGGDVSVLYPLVSTQYIWASFWSVRWLGERMNFLKWIGIALIIGGVTLINIAR